jgi:hypothetical protein
MLIFTVDDVHACIGVALENFEFNLESMQKNLEDTVQEGKAYIKQMNYCFKNTTSKMETVLCSYNSMSLIPPVLTKADIFEQPSTLKMSVKDSIESLKNCERRGKNTMKDLDIIKNDLYACIENDKLEGENDKM